MSWKDRWTAFCWRITFPGEAMPLEILPSNYARLAPPEEPKKTSIEDALTQTIIMDMNIYPSAWSRVAPRWTYDETKYLNKDADVKIIFSGINERSAKVNGVEVGESNRKKLIDAFNKRFGAEVLERLLDRVEKIKEVTVEEVKEAARPKLVDPFAEAPMETLSKHLAALTKAAQEAKALPPPPRKLISNSSNLHMKKIVKANKYTQSTTRKPEKLTALAVTKQPKKLQLPKHSSTFQGKAISKLDKSEMQELLDYSFGREF